MDIDLEQEFQKLMRTVIKQIEDKVLSGELPQLEAADLIRMVEDRMQAQKEELSLTPAWNRSDWCAESDYEGWQHSRCW